MRCPNCNEDMPEGMIFKCIGGCGKEVCCFCKELGRCTECASKIPQNIKDTIRKESNNA